MSSIFDKLVGRRLIKDYPGHIKNNIHYEAVVGSISYGVSGDESDVDVYGFSMPPRHLLFPYEHGKIFGFGKPPAHFNQFQKHHIMDDVHKKEYDISIYSIVRFFQLCMESNPNMVDALFVPQRCVLHSTQLGNYVRDRKGLFLSQLCWHKFKGYAFSQLSKMNDKTTKQFCDVCRIYDLPLDVTLEDAMKKVQFKDENYVTNLFKKIDQSGHRSKRLPSIMKYGYDVKFAYNVVRLLEEVEMILTECTLDLTRSREMLKSIRKGEWEIERVNTYFQEKYPILERAYERSLLPRYPREEEIGKLLSECIYMHYGDSVVKNINMDSEIRKATFALQDQINHLAKLVG